MIKIFNKYLRYFNDLLDKKRIKKYDSGDASKRDFELVSTRNYEVQCMDLFEEVFKEPMTKEFWNWKYAPHGMKWRGVCAVKEGKVIGHYNGVVRNIIYFGEWKKVVAAGDTMVSPKARGGFKKNSPFYTMVSSWTLSNVGQKKAFYLVFGFPNRRVMSLAEKVGLYKEVDTTTEIVWNISATNVTTESNLEKYVVNEKTNAEVLEVWRAMIVDFKGGIISVRNSDYLTNRYIKHPKFAYELFLVRDQQKKLQAVFVLKKENDKMLLMDVVAKKENFPLAIAGAFKVAHEKQCKNLKCWITSSKAQLFDHNNAALKQIDVSIAASSIIPGFDPMSTKDKWFLMYGDTDFI